MRAIEKMQEYLDKGKNDGVFDVYVCVCMCMYVLWMSV